MAITNHVLTTESLKQIVKHNNDTFATKTSLDEVKKSIPTVDADLKADSTNAIQNKAVTTALSGKFDSTSTANDGKLTWYDKSQLTGLEMNAPKLAVQSATDDTSMTFIGTSDITVVEGTDSGVTAMRALSFNKDNTDAPIAVTVSTPKATGKAAKEGDASGDAGTTSKYDKVTKNLASTDYVDSKVGAIKSGVTEVKAGKTANILTVTTNGTAADITINDVAHAAAADNANTVNNLTVETAVPANAVFTDTVYTHPDSGVTAGTYTSVTVDAKGHVTAGTNPNTLAGYGIGDAYTKTEVDGKISTIPKFAIAVVDDLPTKDISGTTVYLKKTGDESGNLYTEYIYVTTGSGDDAQSAWEELGTQTVDLSGYLTKADAGKTYVAKDGYVAYSNDEKTKLAGLYQTGNAIFATVDVLSTGTVELSNLVMPEGYTAHVGDMITDSNGDHYYITAVTAESGTKGEEGYVPASVTVGNAIGTNPLASYQKALTFDKTPTADSTNPVTSGGIATAIANITVVEATADEVTAILNGTSST